MKRYNKILNNFLVCLSLFIIFVSFVGIPKAIAHHGGGHHGGGHHGGGHHGRGRGGIQFRFDVSPRQRYYYHPYYEYVLVRCEIFDDENSRVTDVQIGNKVIHVYGSEQGVRYDFSLRPGYYTIRWNVASDRFLGPKHRSYSRRLRVYSDRDQIYVTIKGSRIYVD